MFNMPNTRQNYEDSFLMGIDIGTSSAKGCIFDIRGKSIAEASAGYDIITPNPGWREQRAEWWLDAVVRISRDLIKKVNSREGRIMGVAITHQRLTFVPVDRNIEPIYNAILWNDVRCAHEVDYARKNIGEKEVFRKTGVSPGYWSIYKILWLKNNMPEIYEKAYKFVLVPDFICFKLTGKLVTTQSAAILTGALDVNNPNRWCTDIICSLGLSEDKFVDDIMPSGVVIGEVTAQASKLTGIPARTPVITAAGDQPCGSLGAGLTKVGQVAVNGGTSCTSEILCESLPSLDDPKAYYLEISPTGRYIAETTIPSGAADLMKWFRRNFGWKLISEAREKGEDVWTYIYQQAASSPPGSLGLMLVPYFNSSGPPYWDLNTGGVIIGLTTDTQVRHFIRAIMEGLAFEVKRHIRLLEKGSGVKIAELLMYGGSSRSDTWNQIFSDVCGIKVVTSKTPETTSLGAAICAAVGNRIYRSFDEAVKEMVHVRRIYTPNVAVNHLYEKLFEQCYLEIYERLRELILKLIKIARAHDEE